MQRTRISDLAWDELHSPTRKFHSFFRNVSLALGGVRNGGTWCGGHPFDVQIRRVPAGASVCPFHLHLAQWEMFLVQSGAGSVRTTESRTPIRAGHVFFHPPGTAHQLTADAGVDLEVLIVTDNPPLDGCYYPDSGKWALRPPGKVFRMHEAGYFDGEDPPPPGAPPFQIAAAPASVPPVNFAQRYLHIDDLVWEEWTSPKKKFRGSSKELSIALGAKRNTPAGMGGHPFDLELQKLAPGETGCPFHSHAAQWEMFLVTRGRATVRVGTEREELVAGDVVVHPPREAHQILNPGPDDLEFLLIADNPPVDYWHYPDSGKWGLREPRMFFRPNTVAYYDGEE